MKIGASPWQSASAHDIYFRPRASRVDQGSFTFPSHRFAAKIALNAVVADSDITDRQRDKVLAEMTDDVAVLVLRDNYFQNQGCWR